VAGPRREAFRQALHDLGYVEGRNVVYEYRSADTPDGLPAAAADLLAMPLDLVITGAEPGARALKNLTGTIPIVMTSSVDPVGLGIVASLARPGENVTGVATLDQELVGKRLELLKETVPGLSRVSFLSDPSSVHYGLMLRALQPAAEVLRIDLQSVEVRQPADIETALEAILRHRSEAVIPHAQPALAPVMRQIMEFARQKHLPTIYAARELVERGGLMSYGASYVDMHRRSATYVAKILRGAKPTELPIEQPREFELVINLKTAEAFGLMIPHHVLLQATEVIQ
jgi:putative ABC transport system substrate-binding protein